jgi:hypothetical protein
MTGSISSIKIIMGTLRVGCLVVIKEMSLKWTQVAGR